jgi:tRNA A-37 threonylcarbamoyl transferase component Bud32
VANPAWVNASLPPALREASLRRLVWVVRWVCLALVASEALHWLQVHLGNEESSLMTSAWRAFSVALSLQVQSHMNQFGRPPAQRLLWFRCWLGHLCLQMATVEYLDCHWANGYGVSRVALVIALVPALIADGRARNQLFCWILLGCIPLGYGLAQLGGAQAWPLSNLLINWSNNLVATLAGWVAGSSIYQLQEAIQTEYGSYRKVRLLGKGAFGEVWEAAHRLLPQRAAIKVLQNHVKEPEALARFLLEARTLSQLRSPHTIRVFDYGQGQEGQPFLVMELLEGKTFEQLIAESAPMPEVRVARLLSQVCLSLAEAHQHGLVHRDLKPANLFLCDVGGQPDFVKVLDFGLVKPVTEIDTNLTQVDQLVGTPEFMSPEQIQGLSLDGHSDLYSLGCIGYWMATGRKVFPEGQGLEILVHHLHTPPPAWPNSDRLAKILSPCLAKTAEHRPHSAHELYQHLERIYAEHS